MKLQSKTVQHLFIRLLGEDTSFGGPGCVYQDVASSDCPERSFGGLLAAGQLAQVGGMERRLHVRKGVIRVVVVITEGVVAVLRSVLAQKRLGWMLLL